MSPRLDRQRLGLRTSRPSMTMRCVAAFAGARVDPCRTGGENHDLDGAARPRRQARARTAACGSSHLGLQHLGVLQMRDERRADLGDQRLQLLVLGARDQRLVDSVENLLVVGDFVVDVGLVERRAA